MASPPWAAEYAWSRLWTRAEPVAGLAEATDLQPS